MEEEFEMTEEKQELLESDEVNRLQTEDEFDEGVADFVWQKLKERGRASVLMSVFYGDHFSVIGRECSESYIAELILHLLMHHITPMNRTLLLLELTKLILKLQEESNAN
jgi:hypothetical protein